MHAKPSSLLAVLAVLPFVVAFAPPREEGTHLSVAAGSGRFISYTGCANPRLVEFTDQQVGIHHRWEPYGSWQTRFGVGMEMDFLQGRQKECTESDCRNASPGWIRQPDLVAWSPHVSADWRWVGLSVGGRAPLYRAYVDSLYNIETANILNVPVRGRIRLGREDLFYLAFDVLNGRPVSSGSTFPWGLGGRLFGTDLWLAPLPEFKQPHLSGAVSRPVGPVRVTLAGRWYPDEVDVRDSGSDQLDTDESFSVSYRGYGLSLGLDYRLPW
jgi:hypothetical protein